MRLLICTLFLLYAPVSVLLAQTDEKERARHQKDVARSAKNQDAIISLDTLFYAGKPYAKILRKNKYESNYQFLSLSGQPYFWVDQEVNVPIAQNGPPSSSWRVYTFLIDSVAQTASVPVFLKLAEKDLAEEIFKFGLLDEKGLNREKIAAFLDRFPGSPPEKEEARTYDARPRRDLSKPVYYKSGSAIAQDNVTIAMAWKKRDRRTNETRAQLFDTEGRRTTVFLYLPNAHNSIEFETYLDGKRHHLDIKPEKDPVLEITAYLVAKGYL